MPFFLSHRKDVFPHPFLADEDGLLAISDSLSCEQILLSYQFGIFPWSNEDEPVFWWTLHPRCVLYPNKVRVSRSMTAFIKKNKYHCTLDTSFEKVIDACQNITRKGQGGTWITSSLKSAFIELYHQGHAHSIEVWEDNELVGGVYGLAIGKIFFGESMFSKKTNASKLGVIMLSKFLHEKGFKLIDCQQETNHLKSLGAELISKESFMIALRNNIFASHNNFSWKLE